MLLLVVTGKVLMLQIKRAKFTCAHYSWTRLYKKLVKRSNIVYLTKFNDQPLICDHPARGTYHWRNNEYELSRGGH